MNTIFIGGSRHVTRLPDEVKVRIENVVSQGHRVIVGDANGADKAVQTHLSDAHYGNVTVFCSGEKYRNNVGSWPTSHVVPGKSVKGFQFYAEKDRAMAQAADFGLMIWDGKSPGTILNVLRLVRAGKIAVLFSVPEKKAINFKTESDWDGFFALCDAELKRDIQDRATPQEWQPHGSLLSMSDVDQGSHGAAVDASPDLEQTKAALIEKINNALASADTAVVLHEIGNLARLHGMTHVAKEAGLARESLYRALNIGGNPEFSTVLKVMGSIGVQLSIGSAGTFKMSQ